MEAKDEMSKYYDCRQTPAPVYQPGYKVYLDASNIQTTRPSQKLAHKRLRPFTIVRTTHSAIIFLRTRPYQFIILTETQT